MAELAFCPRKLQRQMSAGEIVIHKREQTLIGRNNFNCYKMADGPKKKVRFLKKKSENLSESLDFYIL